MPGERRIDANLRALGFIAAITQLLKAKTVTSSATPTFDWTTAPVQQMTLSANVTAVTFTAPNVGTGEWALVVLKLTQNSSGNWTAAGWPSAIKWRGGSAPTITATGGETDIFVFLYDGTNYWELVRSQDLS